MLASAKHFAFNDQETDRMTVDVHVDERTRREIAHLPPFEAAVKRGRRPDVLLQPGRRRLRLREPAAAHRLPAPRLGFDGFVEVRLGRDPLDRPGGHGGHGPEMHASPVPQRYFSADNLRAALADDSLTRRRVDEMVRNVVRPMFEHGLFDHPSSPGRRRTSATSRRPHGSGPAGRGREHGAAEEPRRPAALGGTAVARSP